MANKWWKPSFLWVLIKRAAISNCWIVEVPPTFRPKIPTSETFQMRKSAGNSGIPTPEDNWTHHKPSTWRSTGCHQSDGSVQIKYKFLNSAICIDFCTFVLCLIEHSTWIITRLLIRNGRLTILNPKTRFSARFLSIDWLSQQERSLHNNARAAGDIWEQKFHEHTAEVSGNFSRQQHNVARASVLSRKRANLHLSKDN